MRVRRTGLPAIAATTLGAVTMLALGAASAPAGNREPVRTLVASPGPSEISYGENVGYTATLVNSQSSTFTKVIYRHKVPTTVIGGVATPATLEYASCEPTRTSWPAFAAGSWYACPELSQVRAGETANVLLVWKAPGLPTQGDGITCGAAFDCVLRSQGEWTIKEGTGRPGSSGPDTFPVGPVSTPLYAASTDLTKARGYVLDTCSGGSSLETSLLTPVGPTNRLHTRVCAPTLPGAAANPLNPGLVVEIEETATGHIAEDVTVCIPNPGQSCAASAYTPWTFSPRATFTFTIDNRTLPAGETIDSVLHDDDGNGTFDTVTADCTITVVHGLQVTIVTCTASRNGEWRFG